MTQAKKLKRLARERAARTGESYATARRHVLAKVETKRAERSEAAATKARAATATGTVSEARCIEKTGHGFSYWFSILDKFGAPKHGHTAAAAHLREAHGVSPWYCQAITVSYERARNLRSLNQACAGDFQVSVSRVLPFRFERALRQLEASEHRAQWTQPLSDALATAIGSTLDGGELKVLKAKASVRFRLPGSAHQLELTEHGDGRSRIGVRVTRLANADDVERHRQAWRASLDLFRETSRD